MSQILLSGRVAALLSLLFVLSACEADEPAGPAMLGLELDATLGSAPLAVNQTLTLNGRAVTITNARVYLNDLVLLHEDGREIRVTSTPVTLPARDEAGETVQHTVSESTFLAALDGASPRDRATLGEVPAGRYLGLRATVGMTGLTNRVDATQAPTGHPLAKRTDVNNHWSWNSGYIFARFDGRHDTDGDGTPDADWRLHLGNTVNATTVEIRTPFTLDGGAAQDVHLTLDVARLLAGVDFSDAAQAFCMSGAACAPTVAAVRGAVPQALTLSGVRDAAN